MNGNKKARWYRDWKLTRNVLLFNVGLCGLISLTVLWIVTSRTPEPSLLIAFTAMMGLPVFLTADEKERSKDGEE